MEVEDNKREKKFGQENIVPSAYFSTRQVVWFLGQVEREGGGGIKSKEKAAWFDVCISSRAWSKGGWPRPQTRKCHLPLSEWVEATIYPVNGVPIKTNSNFTMYIGAALEGWKGETVEAKEPDLLSLKNVGKHQCALLLKTAGVIRLSETRWCLNQSKNRYQLSQKRIERGIGKHTYFSPKIYVRLITWKKKRAR